MVTQAIVLPEGKLWVFGIAQVYGPLEDKVRRDIVHTGPTGQAVSPVSPTVPLS